jgi:hypothetical protein
MTAILIEKYQNNSRASAKLLTDSKALGPDVINITKAHSKKREGRMHFTMTLLSFRATNQYKKKRRNVSMHMGTENPDEDEGEGED